jgi:hypothetical protein
MARKLEGAGASWGSDALGAGEVVLFNHHHWSGPSALPRPLGRGLPWEEGDLADDYHGDDCLQVSEHSRRPRHRRRSASDRYRPRREMVDQMLAWVIARHGAWFWTGLQGDQDLKLYA